MAIIDADFIRRTRLSAAQNPYLAQTQYLNTQLGRAPEGERSFLANIGESFSRGKNDVLADIAVYEALHGAGEDVTGALIARKHVQQRSVVDPIEGKYMVGLLYKAANTAGQVLESAKRAAVGSVIGGVVGGGLGLAGSALFPTVGEEPIATATGAVTGAKLGAKIGGHGAAGMFMYKQGVGSMYADMIEQGIDPKIASYAAHAGGIPYAAIELAQFKLLGAPAKRIISGKVKSAAQATALSAITKGLSTYAWTLGGEVTEEVAQEMVQIATEKGAQAYQEGGLELDRDFLNESVKRMWDVGKGATEAFALIPVPGAAFEAGVSWASTQRDSDIADTINKVDSVTKITPKDFASPELQLMQVVRDKLGEELAIDETAERAGYTAHVQRMEKSGKEPLDFTTYSTQYRSRKLFREQEQARHAERQQKLGKEMGAIREASNFAEYTKAFRRHLSGTEYAKLGITPLEGSLPLESFNALRQQIHTATDKLQNAEAFRLMDALEELYFRGGKLGKSDTKLAAKIWGPNTVEALEALSNIDIKGVEHPLLGINDFARSVASAVDMSYTMRQNKFMIGKPRVFFGTLATQAKVFKGGVNVAKIINRDLATSEAGQAARQAGIRFEEIEGGFETGSEAFPSKLAKRIPVVARSGAAFTVAGNYSRITQYGEIWKANRGSLTEKQSRDIASVINILSGIGDVKMLGKYAHVLNSVFFAPRNFFANVQVWTELLNPKLSWVARKYLTYNLVKWASINAGLLAAMSAVPGVKVDRDPGSTDFGKIVIGKTHLDFWGGQLPIYRTVYRLITGKRTTAGGVEVDAPALETITRFLQSKLGPLPSAAMDIYQGESYVGESREVSNIDDMSAMVYEKVTPFFLQDLVDAIRYQGLQGAAYAPLSFLGVSAQTYTPSKSSEAAMNRDELSREVLGTNWDQLGPDAQQFMRAKFPEIGEDEQAARFEREERNFMSRIEKDIKASQKRMYKAVPEDVRQRLDELKVGLSGVNRRIGTNWYLNNERYEQYQSMVEGAYKAVLPQIIRSDMWNKLNTLGKVEVLKRVTEELKEGARKQIIMKARMADLQRVRYTQGAK